MQWNERAALEAAALAYKLSVQGYLSVAIGFTDDDYGRTASTVFNSVWQGLYGTSVTQSLRIAADKTDYSAEIATLGAAGGQIIVALGELGSAGQQDFLTGLKDIGAFSALAVTSPWYDASFGPSAALGLELSGISIVADAVRSLDTPSSRPVFTSITVMAIDEIDFQIGQAGTANLMRGTSGPDVLFGRAGQDTLRGGDWQDFLSGGVDHDVLEGGNGNDRLYGGSGGDELDGGAGRDTLQGDRGADVLWGDTGADRFVFGTGGGADLVQDFNRIGGDKLLLDDALWGGGLTKVAVVQTFATVTAQGVVLNFGDGDRVTLAGVTSLEGLATSLAIF